MVLYSARQDVVLPLSKPIIGNDGKEMSEIFVPAGTNTMLSLLRANREPEIWGSDSYEWKPERYGPAILLFSCRYPLICSQVVGTVAFDGDRCPLSGGVR